MKTRSGHLRFLFLISLAPPMAHQELICLLPPGMRSFQYIFWWLLDQLAYAVDAFTVSWQDLNFYAFPPFSLLPRVLAKIIQDKAMGILIIPLWTTQSWFPLMLTLLIQHPGSLLPAGTFCIYRNILKQCTHYTRSCPFWRCFYQGRPPGFRIITVSFRLHPGILETWHKGAV